MSGIFYGAQPFETEGLLLTSAGDAMLMQSDIQCASDIAAACAHKRPPHNSCASRAQAQCCLTLRTLPACPALSGSALHMQVVYSPMLFWPNMPWYGVQAPRHCLHARHLDVLRRLRGASHAEGSYSRTLFPPNTPCTGAPGTVVDFSEALDSQPETLSGGPIDVTKLPRDGSLGCTPVYPQKCAERPAPASPKHFSAALHGCWGGTAAVCMAQGTHRPCVSTDAAYVCCLS